MPTGSSLRQLMVTPTFVFSLSVLTMAVLAFGTTQTYLRFSSAGPSAGCGANGCARPDAIHTAGGSTSGGALAEGSARSPAQRSPSPGRIVSGVSPRGIPRTEVAISYRTMRVLAGGFLAEVSLTDRGGPPDGAWWLALSYPGVRILWMAGATWRAGSSDTVIIAPARDVPSIRDGTTVRITIAAAGQPGAPAGCVFEGAHCHVGG